MYTGTGRISRYERSLLEIGDCLYGVYYVTNGKMRAGYRYDDIEESISHARNMSRFFAGVRVKRVEMASDGTLTRTVLLNDIQPYALEGIA